MNPLIGTSYGILGCLLYQLVTLYNYRDNKKQWPWKNKKSGVTISFYIFGIIVKLVAAAGLTWMLVLTGQISGPWAAFASGMVADYAIMKIGDASLRELANDKK